MNYQKKPFCFSRIARQTLFAATFAALGATPLAAQQINEDLRTNPAPVTKKTVKKKTPAVKRPVKKNTGGKRVNITPVKTETPVAPPVDPVKTETPVAPPVDPVKTPVDTETPEQIIERFMNFQQSAGVTRADWESVVRQTTAKLQAAPNDPLVKAQMFIGNGYLQFADNNYSEALIQFNAAEQILSRSALPTYSLGRIYLATNQPAEAERSFERSIKINEDFALAYKGLGEALEAQGKKKKAQNYYQKAASVGLVKSTIAVNPNPLPPVNNQFTPNGGGTGTGVNNANPTVATQTLLSEYELELRAARSLTATKKWQTSIDKLMELSKKNPTAEVYIAIGDNYLGMQQLLSAQQAYQQATTANPQSALAFYKIGSVLFDMNEYQAAADAFERSLILDLTGSVINRANARKMADKAKNKADDLKEKRR